MKRLLLITILTLTTLIVKAVGGGETYRIVSKKYPNKSLFVKDSQREEGADVVLWTETNVPSQQWKVHSVTTDNFALQNVYTGKYAAPRTRTVGGTFAAVGSRSLARLVIETIDEESGLYRIMDSGKSLCLSVASDEDGVSVTWATPDDEDESQQWIFESVEPQTAFNASLRETMIDDYLAHHLHSRGANYSTFYEGGWGESEQLEVLLDAYEATGLERYLTAAKQVYSYFNKCVTTDWTKGSSSSSYHWYGYDFNDDVMWQIIAVARLGWLTGDKSYTNIARRNFDRIYARAFIPFTGMMRWAEQTGDRYGTNSCIQGPTEVAACYLAMSGCGEEYFEKARDIYAAQRRHLAQNMATGKIWDSLVWDPSTETVTSKNEWASTYNQGTMLGAACLLYNHYGDSQYLSDARKIMSYTKSDLCNDYGIIRVCQDPTNGDLCGFKGILMRYVRRFVLELNNNTYRDWTLRNAFHAYCNRDEQGLTSTGWLAKATPSTTTNPFACSTAASAAANAVLGDVVKKGFNPLQSEGFDYHCGLLVEDSEGSQGGQVVQVGDGFWAEYTNINFSADTARSVSFSVILPEDFSTGSIEIYFDSMNGTPAGVCELRSSATAQSVQTFVTDILPTTGRHHLFLRFTNTATKARAYSLDQFQFSNLSAEQVTRVEALESNHLPGSSVGEGSEAYAGIYDLSGRCVSSSSLHHFFTPSLPKGIYVRDGKQVMVR